MAMNSTQIKQFIGKIGRAAAKLNKDVQQCAIECLWHAVEHGDVTLANELLSVLGKGVRRASLYAWFEQHGPFILPKGKDKLGYVSEVAKNLREEGEASVRERLADLPWQEAKPEAAPQSIYDVSDMFDKFMDRLEKLAKDGSIELRHKDMLDKLRGLSTEYHSEQVTRQRLPADHPDVAKV